MDTVTDDPINPAVEIRVLVKTLAAAREHAHRARSEDWPDAMRQAPEPAVPIEVEP